VPPGHEPANTVGWHWAKEMTDQVRPEQGDLFQIGTPAVTGCGLQPRRGDPLDRVGDNPQWVTVEAGQGGPAGGTTSSPEKARAPLKRWTRRIRCRRSSFMGWVDIDEYLARTRRRLAAG